MTHELKLSWVVNCFQFCNFESIKTAVLVGLAVVVPL